VPKFPVVSGEDVIKTLKKAGFEQIGQKGSHVKLRKIDSAGKKTAIVPLRKIIRTGTMKSILRQSHMNLEDFLKFLK